MPKKKILSFILILAIILCLSGCGNKNISEVKENTSDDVLADILSQTVMIYVGESHGSGVVISNTDESIEIATVAHLMENYDQGIITFSNGKTVFGNVKIADKASDISILEIKREFLDEEFACSLAIASIDSEAFERVKEDDTVYLTGSAVSVSANAAEGIIKSKDYFIPEFDENLLYIYADAMPGMSGGGVFTTDGYLIGIIAAGSEYSEVLAIPITEYK